MMLIVRVREECKKTASGLAIVSEAAGELEGALSQI
jgi:hypothetical protein